ncbi:MAG: Sec-independent protein translocase protein TatA [Candidatus Collierbacteria bacterium GW2011_GWC2_45_15]|uniref:Sec-independent protein translocase protein TatA n=2 Tax=Candidatus Collieribacteriota TaxID=1752725 RepID=A0A0G1GPX8_9BACT|nr:MAG: Sec-independent protein translocase protein TatA [Candidatus Collierbacteria bacterium GW2011_GWA1_44_12]KKT96941.1 MAG: Sec-independent protein translocase protein TatA [Candidatus Collierbacteria bacterium GW2011_GWC2_45_15]
MFNNIGKTELIVVAVVLVVLIGGKKLPDLTRGIAAAIKEFKRAFRKESDKKDQSE